MSAPNLPRFVVRSLAGYRIRETFESLPSDKELTEFYVYDTWLNHQVVGRFRSEDKAETLAYKLERRAKRQKPIDPNPRPISPRSAVKHGTDSAYVNWGCRCEPCREAHRAYHRAYKRRRKAAA